MAKKVIHESVVKKWASWMESTVVASSNPVRSAATEPNARFANSIASMTVPTSRNPLRYLPIDTMWA